MRNFRAENTRGFTPAERVELNAALAAFASEGTVRFDDEGELVAVADLVMANWTPGATCDELVRRVRLDLAPQVTPADARIPVLELPDERAIGRPIGETGPSGWWIAARNAVRRTVGAAAFRKNRHPSRGTV